MVLSLGDQFTVSMNVSVSHCKKYEKLNKSPPLIRIFKLQLPCINYFYDCLQHSITDLFLLVAIRFLLT